MFFVKLHLLECRVVENIYRAFVVDQDPVRVIVPYPDPNNECIIIRVVTTLSILF